MPVHLHSEISIIDDINPSIITGDMNNLNNSKNVSMRPYFMTHDPSRRHNAKSECNGNKIMSMNKEDESNEVIDGINYSSNTKRPSLNSSSLSSLPRRKSSSVLDISSLLCDLPSTSSPAYDSSIDGDSSMDDLSTTSQLGDNESSLDSPRSCHNVRIGTSTPDTSPPQSPKDEKPSIINDQVWTKRSHINQDPSVVKPVLPSIRTFASSPNLRSDINSDLPHITNYDNGNLDSRKSWNHNQPLEQFATFTTETYRSDSPINSHNNMSSHLSHQIVRRSSFDVVQTRYTPYPSTTHSYTNNNQRLLPSVDQRRNSDLSSFTSSRGSGQVHDHSYYNQSHNTHYPHYADRSSSTSTYSVHHSPPSFGTHSHNTKRKRANANQLKVLNDVFARTFFPSTELRIQLGKELGMAPRTVQIWFQNKRQSWRSKTRGNSNSSIKDEDDRVENDMTKKSLNSRRSSNSGSSSDLEDDQERCSIPDSPDENTPYHYYRSNGHMTGSSNSGAANLQSPSPPLPPPSSMAPSLPPISQSQINNSPIYSQQSSTGGNERLPTFAQSFAHPIYHHSTNNYESYTSSNRLPAPILTAPRHHAQPLSSTFEYQQTVSSGI
ncbi:44083_t:CDS:2 [Gigaspora margarita]|uniref:44083_t:CDS:1 n=1 Tax=Gigaspora margarita TaxID=4874 RepID=A0ABM8VX70_GIGMA|nr:44083_t:CDS:2 [Gigaspora margarita]